MKRTHLLILKKAYSWIFIIIILGIITILPARTKNAVESKVSAKLQHQIDQISTTGIITAWIFFTDKGSNLEQKIIEVKQNLLPNSYERRLRSRPAERLVDVYDLPVEKAYIKQISTLVKRIRHKSRWLNAVSVEVSKEEIEKITLTEEEIEDAVHYAKASAGWSTYLNGMQVDYEKFTAELLESIEYIKNAQLAVK